MAGSSHSHNRKSELGRLSVQHYLHLGHLLVLSLLQQANQSPDLLRWMGQLGVDHRIFDIRDWTSGGPKLGAVSIPGIPGSDVLKPKSPFSILELGVLIKSRFLGVDAYWALCMAINVYLAFFRGFSIKQLRALDLPYLLVCYGLAFIPAIVFIFISNEDRGKIYGPAIIWCWITTDWDFLRIVILYAIVWYILLFFTISKQAIT